MVYWDRLCTQRETGRTPTYGTANTNFLRAHTTIPIPAVVKDWVDKNGRHFTMVERVEGETLEAAWPKLSSDAKDRIAEQTANFLQQLRNLQSDKMASIGDAPLYGGFLWLQNRDGPDGPFASDDELWQCMERRLEKLPQKARDALRMQIPPCAPYTFTNGALHFDSIIVKDGSLAGIVGWSRAGYKPVWWEYTAAAIGFGEVDAEWKALLRSKMQPSDDARVFWKKFWTLGKYPDLDDYGKEVLEELLQEQK